MKSFVYIDTQISTSVSAKVVAVVFTETMVPIDQNRWNHITLTIKSHDTNQTFTFFTVCVLQFSLNYLLFLLVLLVLPTCNYIRHHCINQR